MFLLAHPRGLGFGSDGAFGLWVDASFEFGWSQVFPIV